MELVTRKIKRLERGNAPPHLRTSEKTRGLQTKLHRNSNKLRFDGCLTSQEGGASPLPGTEVPTLRTLPDLALCTSASGCSSVSFTTNQ